MDTPNSLSMAIIPHTPPITGMEFIKQEVTRYQQIVKENFAYNKCEDILIVSRNFAATFSVNLENLNAAKAELSKLCTAIFRWEKSNTESGFNVGVNEDDLDAMREKNLFDVLEQYYKSRKNYPNNNNFLKIYLTKCDQVEQ